MKYHTWTFFAWWKEIDQLLFGLICKAGFSFDPNSPWPFSVTKWNSCGSFWLKQFTFQTKERKKIWNFDPFCPLQANWLIFWDLIWKAGFSLDSNFPWPFIVTKWNSCGSCWLKQFTFQTKDSNKIWNLDPFCPLQTNWLIFVGLIWKAGFSFSQNFLWPFSMTK